MEALEAFNEHIRSKKLGKYLLGDKKGRSFSDGSTISPSDGSGSLLLISQNKPGGYNFTYNVNNRRISDLADNPYPAGVELDTARWNVDQTDVGIAKTGHTPAYKMALDAITRRRRLDKVTIRSLANRSDAELQVIERVRQRAQARTVEKFTQAMSAASQTRPPESSLDVLGPEDEELGRPGQIVVTPSTLDQSPPTDYSAIEKTKPEDLAWNKEWKLPNQAGLSLATTAGKLATLLVKSKAFQDMVGVKASRHAAVRRSDLDYYRNGVGVVKYPVEKGGDGSEIRYRLDPTPIIGQEGTQGAGIAIHRVLGFTVTVPHLQKEADAEHSYTRDQDVRAGLNDDGEPFGVVTRMTHQIARNDAKGNTHWSEPLAHEVGEAGEDRYSDLTPRQEERIETERSLAGMTLSDEDYVLDERRHKIETGYQRNKQGYSVESIGGLRKVLQSGSESMRLLLHRQVAAHYGPIPESMGVQDLTDLLAEARARQDITDITKVKADLVAKYADDLHPENIRDGGKGFNIDPDMDPDTIRYQKYIDKHFGRMLGMARGIKKDSSAPAERVGAAGDFLLDMFRQLPTQPKRAGGRNWLKIIRDDAAAKANPKPGKLRLVTTPEKPGRKEAAVVPHDAEIEQVHGVTLIVQHKKGNKNVSTPRELNPQEHPEVFAATTIGELHQAIHKIRTVNPHTARTRNMAPKAPKKKIDPRAWRTGAQPEPEPEPEIGALPHRSQVRVTLAGEESPTVINSTPETGAPHTYRIDQGQASRVATVSWSIYHPYSGKVVMTPRNTVAVFSSQSKAVAHAQKLQAEGVQSGHILVPLYKSSQRPIDTPIHPDYMPREPGVDIPMIGRLATPQWVEGKTVREIPWGEAGGGLHAGAIQRIKEERDATARIGLHALKESMLNPNQMTVPETHDSVLTRPPQNAKGQVPLRAGFTPVP